jgi:hypothetical protein
MAKHKEYYKGEGDGFPQVWAMVNLVRVSTNQKNYRFSRGA